MQAAPIPHRVAALAALALALVACSTPVGVERVDARRVHRSLTANVLASGTPSAASLQVVLRLGLWEPWQRDPDAALREIHAGLAEGDVDDRLFALAELSFLHAERTGKRAWYRAAAVYAYAFLFPEAGAPASSRFDPRQRLAALLYNRGLTAGLERRDDGEIRLRPGRQRLPFGELLLEVDPQGFLWGGHRLGHFVPAAELEVRGLRNRYRHAGLGAPLAAALERVKGAQPAGAVHIPKRIRVPVTALVRIEAPRRALFDGRLRGRLELYAGDDATSTEIGGSSVPLELEPTAALAYGLETARFWDFELPGFFGVDLGKREHGLLLLHPYRRGRVPVVLVHGTASSPARWAEMVNELVADPLVRERCQIWLFSYDTGNPIPYSASLLRQALAGALAEVDPEGRDPALRRMVVVGHSQGGLLAKLTAIESGTRFWELASRVPFESLDLGDETREHLRRIFFFEPIPAVERVVFIATPHRGSYRAAQRVGRFASFFVTLPLDLVRLMADVFQRNPDALALRSLDELPNSVDQMDPGSPFVRTLAEIPVAPSVSAHSIVAVQGEGLLEELGDGVVDYLSAHLEGAVSEWIVRSGHSTQSSPHTIAEVRRILHEHLEAR